MEDWGDGVDADETDKVGGVGFAIVTLGLYCNRSVGRIKGNQATFDNSQQNNLRSCVCGFGGSVGEDVRAGFPLFPRETSFFLWWRP